ncbi:MAG: archease [Actinomycetota bacterium]|nr:archease [Actinomycetota bacterium]
MTYTWIEHTAEVELAIEAASAAGVFVEATTALAELIARDPGGEAARREISLSAADRAALLADWLEELVFLADTEGFVPEGVASLELRGDSVRATVEGRIDRPAPLVKAVTYHRLEFAEDDGGARARLVLDV